MRALFERRFHIDFQRNKLLFNVLIEHENQLSPFVIKSFSHLLNTHHIWLSRLNRTRAESNLWDILPIEYGLKFAEENHRKTIAFLDDHELNEKINYHDSEGVALDSTASDILFHILDHNTYHRAQINLELRTLQIPPASITMIPYL